MKILTLLWHANCKKLNMPFYATQEQIDIGW